MVSFLSGMITAGFLVAALFFFRFWKRTGDTLFATFGFAFVVFAIGQAISATFNLLQDDQSLVFALRLLGFGLLLVAIARKNLARPKP